MSTYIHKSHNVSVLIYHLVCPAKYRRVVFDEAVDETLKDICLKYQRGMKLFFCFLSVNKTFLSVGDNGSDHMQQCQIGVLKLFTADQYFNG